MPVRFRKSIRLGKHIRLNISRSGIGYSAGVKGFRIGTGPRGTRITAGIPGSGLSYSKTLGRTSAPKQAAISRQVAVPKPPSPGFLAPRHEKDLYNGLVALEAGDQARAIPLLLSAAPKEPGAALFAGALLATKPGSEGQAMTLLEGVVQSDAEFPTPLMSKYLTAVSLTVCITPRVKASVPVDGLGAALLLAELYQDQQRIDDAIGLLEEVDDLSGEPVVTLSLCDLYAGSGLWEGVIERASNVAVNDDVTLETVIIYAQALQMKELHEAAIAVLSNALKKKKDRNPDLLRDAAYFRAVSYEATKKVSQANKEFQKIYAEAPKYRDVAQRLGLQ